MTALEVTAASVRLGGRPVLDEVSLDVRGGELLVLADLLARTAVEYQELPLGVLTAAVGGPFFFWLLRRTRARSGGWA